MYYKYNVLYLDSAVIWWIPTVYHHSVWRARNSKSKIQRFSFGDLPDKITYPDLSYDDSESSVDLIESTCPELSHAETESSANLVEIPVSSPVKGEEKDLIFFNLGLDSTNPEDPNEILIPVNIEWYQLYIFVY